MKKDKIKYMTSLELSEKLDEVIMQEAKILKLNLANKNNTNTKEDIVYV